MLEAPYPELDDLLTMMGEAGRHLAEIEASEGAAGNISVCLRWPVELRTRFPGGERNRTAPARPRAGRGNLPGQRLGPAPARDHR